MELGAFSLSLAVKDVEVSRAFYQKLGFNMTEIRRDYFTQNYPEPIWENGIQCKHMIMFEYDFY